MSPLRVAAAQAGSVSGDVETNVGTAVGLVEQAAQQQARVVVLPELFLTGYDPDAWSHEASLSPEDGRLEALRHAAQRARAVVVSSAALRRAPDVSTISLLVFTPGGEVVDAYDKQHLTDEEQPFFTPGSHGASVRVDGWQLGLGVCYDGCFPEHAMTAVADGATAYLCPAAYYVGSEHRRDLYYAARALDNGIYVVLAGLTGRCGSHEFNGGSAIYEPEGRPLERLGRETGVAVADLDTAEVERVQAMNPIGRDRRADLGEPVRTVAS
ncbi:MAG TPA: carbon-nitrogen hydrolase family protein [Nocardioidaceae bacterium]|nr:carbon-nitrogen hydrolase family protein [Nocardioidaceae bacterium]